MGLPTLPHLRMQWPVGPVILCACTIDEFTVYADGRIVRQVGVVNTSASALAMASGGHMEHALLLAGYFMEAGHQVCNTGFQHALDPSNYFA